jgi:hypothetical protein
MLSQPLLQQQPHYCRMSVKACHARQIFDSRGECWAAALDSATAMLIGYCVLLCYSQVTPPVCLRAWLKASRIIGEAEDAVFVRSQSKSTL